MKGTLGLIIAGALGVLAVALNWFYLASKTGDATGDEYLGVRAGVVIEEGDVINDADLENVKIPAELNSKWLKNYVMLAESRPIIVGTPATRTYEGPDVVLQRDFRTPPAELKISDGVDMIWIPVDDNSFVPSLVDPGDLVTFIVPLAPTELRPAPTPAPAPGEGPFLPPAEAGGGAPTTEFEMIGPFPVQTIGNRISSADVMKANRLAQTHERLIGIVVKREGTQYERDAMRLLARTRSREFGSISVALHPKSD